MDRLDRWVQILGVLGIVAGLVLVSAELRQNALLVRAELGSGSMAYRQTMLTSVQGETLADAMAAALRDPAGLTLEQQVVLDAYYANVVGQLLRQSYLLRLGVFQDPLEPFVAVQARMYFGNAYARAWWEQHRNDYPDRIARLLDQELEALPSDRDRERFARLRASFGS